MPKSKLIIIFSALLVFLIPISLSSQTETSELSSIQIADNMKYQNGIEFMKINDYTRALNEFNEYLEIFIHGIHRSSVYRKLAEIHISRFDYQKAINAYNGIYQEYSYSDEGIKAYFDAGICYKKMGYDRKAGEIFRFIISEHPGTSAAYNSEIQLDLIKIISR
jgi:TolA-binding protein